MALTNGQKISIPRLLVATTTTIVALFICFIILSYFQPAFLRNMPIIGPALRYTEMILFAPKLPAGELYGIDISVHQGEIDWDNLSLNYDHVTRRITRDGKASQRISFIIAKATEGVTIKDKMYNDNMKNIRKGGYIAGAYHYYSTLSNAKAQAEAFIKTAQLQKGDLAPIIDVESMGKMTPEKLRKSVLEFISILEKHYKCTPIIYTSANFRLDNLSTEDFDRFTFWIGHYGVDKPKVDCSFWQFTEKAQINGISGKVDVDVFFDDRESFSKLLIP